MEAEIIKLIGVGGDLTSIVMLMLFFKMHNRIARLEFQQESCCAKAS